MCVGTTVKIVLQTIVIQKIAAEDSEIAKLWNDAIESRRSVVSVFNEENISKVEE